jgi:CubicO group peptidase (beta-lactamase class C family)
VGGYGGLTVDGPTPDADSVFRIASMTKSFTAAVVLMLRDEGALSLDDPVGFYLPELAELRGPTTDSPPVTVRALLTMSAGLPTDDPWADRQLPLTPDAFDALLHAGFRFAWAPGTAFEYSNLAWALLGRVITAAAGEDFRRVLTSRVLRPLGMSSTVFEAEQVAPSKLAVGHRQIDGNWAELPFAGHGEFAPMGGLFSSLRDLARWVGEFTDAFPPRDDVEGNHVLSRSTRREMQQVHRVIPPALSFPSADRPPLITAGGYGFGLIVEHDLRRGEIIWHLGGLPGFGSAMRWHPSSGLGVVALANATYSPCFQVVAKALDMLLSDNASPIRVAPWLQTLAAQGNVMKLLDRWDPDLASRVFAGNVDMDEPLVNRRANVERIREQIGELSPDQPSAVEVTSPAGITWWMRGKHGRVKVEIRMNPEMYPEIQTLELTVVPNPSRGLRRVAAALTEATSEETPEWPTELAAEPGQDTAAYARLLRATAIQSGRCRLGEPIAGDGDHTATFRLIGERADVDLTICVDPASGAVTYFSLVPLTLGRTWFRPVTR